MLAAHLLNDVQILIRPLGRVSRLLGGQRKPSAGVLWPRQNS